MNGSFTQSNLNLNLNLEARQWHRFSVVGCKHCLSNEVLVGPWPHFAKLRIDPFQLSIVSSWRLEPWDHQATWTYLKHIARADDQIVWKSRAIAKLSLNVRSERQRYSGNRLAYHLITIVTEDFSLTQLHALDCWECCILNHSCTILWVNFDNWWTRQFHDMSPRTVAITYH